MHRPLSRQIQPKMAGAAVAKIQRTAEITSSRITFGCITVENHGRGASRTAHSTPASQLKLLQASRKMDGSATEGSINAYSKKTPQQLKLVLMSMLRSSTQDYACAQDV